jgi:hypothetical protein
MGTHAKSASESSPIGLKWGGATRLALLLGIVGLGCWIIDKRVHHSAGMALYAVLAILFCAAIGLVSSGIAAERQAAWSFVTWFEGGCFGVVSREGIHYRRFFRRRFLSWAAIFQLDYFPSESGKIEVSLFSSPQPLVFQTSAWSRYSSRELTESPPSAVRILRDHLGDKVFVVRADKSSSCPESEVR